MDKAVNSRSGKLQLACWFEKACTGCYKVLPLNKYGKNKANYNGRSAKCLICKNKDQAENREKNNPKVVEISGHILGLGKTRLFCWFEKPCTRCYEVLPLSAYSKKSSSFDSKDTICKACKSKSQKRYAQSNPEKVQVPSKAQRKQYYAENKELMKAQAKASKARRKAGNPNYRLAELDLKKKERKVAALRNKLTKIADHYHVGLDDVIQNQELWIVKYNGFLVSCDFERCQQKLCKVNGREAWKYWLYCKAPDTWLNGYYKALGKPWLDHRLSSAEKYKLKYALNVEFQLKERLRNQLRKRAKRDNIAGAMRLAINRNGSSPLVKKLLGYTISDLKRHLESQFTEGMNWQAFMCGSIHIDHIVPKWTFEFSDFDDDEFKKCWGLENLQPLWAEDNLKKGGKYGEGY